MLQLGGFALLSACLTLLNTAVRTDARAPPRVIGSGEPIRVAPGDDVILPCHLEPKYNVEGLTVEWSKPDLQPDPADRLSRVEYVHFYRDGREVLDLKIRSYLRRTELFTDDLKDGNISLRIKNVTLADQGSYRCFIPKLRGPVTASTIQLVVAPQSDETPPPTNLPNPDEHRETDVEVPSSGGRLYLSALAGGLFLFLFLFVVVGVCLHKRNPGKQNYDVAPTAPLTA
ncbi:CD276 antigen-like [Cyclopterus lumpus]|uniref:CD276 antigen-like n=1 Tax=Cyclopterus lumpus TaxID=8103 RepID=UPI001486F2E0|nr:CD276 antigen-like [Cyclopterus lumpus]